jgi:microcompartment protein CcmK/EutM
MRTSTILVTAILIAPAGLSAQDQDGAEIRVQAVMDAAAKADIPLALLTSKLEEGRAKGVSMDRIAQALEARLNGLLRAQEVLAAGEIEGASEGDLAVTADALEAGVSEAALLQIQSSARGERRMVATAVLTALCQLGHVPEEALSRVEAALQRGPDALANLRAETALQMRARGIHFPNLPDAAGAGVASGIG